MGVPAHKRVVIPNGIDMTAFAPVAAEEKAALRARLGLPEGVLVVYTGRLASEKRVEPLVRQWHQLRAVHPDATLVLVGDGPQAAALRALQAPGVLLAGAQADIAPWLQAADLFVMPSASEGFSISTLEALACGLPAVATRVGAIPELVNDPATGRLVEPDDMPALFAALGELLAQRPCWPQMGAAARGLVVEDYSLENIAQRLLGLYRQL
jgi:glycosyltransferase involved in cell wall biosynthesis